MLFWRKQQAAGAVQHEAEIRAVKAQTFKKLDNANKSTAKVVTLLEKNPHLSNAFLLPVRK